MVRHEPIHPPQPVFRNPAFSHSIPSNVGYQLSLIVEPRCIQGDAERSIRGGDSGGGVNLASTGRAGDRGGPDGAQEWMNYLLSRFARSDRL